MAINMNFFTEEELQKQKQTQRESTAHVSNEEGRVMWTAPTHKRKTAQLKRVTLGIGMVILCLIIVASVVVWSAKRSTNENSNIDNTASARPSVEEPIQQQEHEESPVESPEPTSVPGPDVKKDDWFALLVNAEKPVPDQYEMTDEEVVPGSGFWLDHRILESYWAMVAAAKQENLDLIIVSGYRGKDVQQKRYNEKVQQLRNQGMDDDAAKQEALRSVQPGGCSEHNLGLAVDLVSKTNQRLAEFAQTPEYEWLVKHAAEYGFIERYPLGKEEVTGVEAKPYHWRYVGNELAKFLKSNDLTLDEFYIQYLVG